MDKRIKLPSHLTQAFEQQTEPENSTEKLLDAFEKYFNDVPDFDPKTETSPKNARVQSFGAGFANLAKVLPDLADPHQPDLVSDTQKKAIGLLSNLHQSMSPEQRENVMEALDKIHRKDRLRSYPSDLGIDVFNLLPKFK